MNFLKTDLLKDRIPKAILLFSVPILLSNLFQAFYNTADTMIVGHLLGDDALAAMGSCAALYELITGFATGVGTGFSIITAKYFGAGDHEKLRKTVAASLVLGLGITVFLSAAAILGLRPFLKVLETPETIFQESYSYISVIAVFMVVFFAYNLCAGLLRAIGDSMTPLFFLIFSSLLNIVLDYTFIRFLHMGVAGTAIATIVSQGISAVLCFLYMIRRYRTLLLPKRDDFRPEGGLWTELLKQGLSVGFMMAIVMIGSTVIQRPLNRLGTVTIAAYLSGRKIYSFLLMPLICIPSALSTFVSQNSGAGQTERISKGVTFAHAVATAWCLACIVIALFFGQALTAAVSGSSTPSLIENGARYVLVNTFFFPFLGVLGNLRYAMQGLGEKVVPVVSSGIELAGKILFAIFIIPKLGFLGIILCEPVLWVIMFLHLVIAFYGRKRNRLF